jgi:phosphoenolpyruvate carboxykinase (ATP)
LSAPAGRLFGTGPLASLELRGVHRNLGPAALITHAVRNREGVLTAAGALATETGKFTGRSPKDKFFVRRPAIADEIAWSEVNQGLDPDRFEALKARALRHAAERTLYQQDLHAGADPDFRLRVRVLTEQAWPSLFARNMFIRPAARELDGFEPDWTVLQLPSFAAQPERDGTRSPTVIAVDFEERLVLIGSTAYAGEIKKSIFGVLNYLLPSQGVMPMHCSANIGPRGDVALFFGLSGTGKTTLSADPNRTLIGDDEHGWGPNGVFNFEGGCYAKVIRLDPEAEPEIWAASNQFGAIVENVVLDPRHHIPDFEDASRTENTRSSYPLDFIPNASETGRAGHPRSIVMLTADAFGVLPPIARLTPAQAMYHFLSGYTARLAGTERGVTEPQATFSTCFGAPFMPRHPTVYAELLGRLMREHSVTCWLVNTGWTGGSFGTGRRMPLAATRALLHAALDGSLAGAPCEPDPVFGLAVPTACGSVEGKLLKPRATWQDPRAYDSTAREVARRFESNFAQFHGKVPREIEAAGIAAAA